MDCLGKFLFALLHFILNIVFKNMKPILIDSKSGLFDKLINFIDSIQTYDVMNCFKCLNDQKWSKVKNSMSFLSNFFSPFPRFVETKGIFDNLKSSISFGISHVEFLCPFLCKNSIQNVSICHDFQ